MDYEIIKPLSSSFPSENTDVNVKVMIAYLDLYINPYTYNYVEFKYKSAFKKDGGYKGYPVCPKKQFDEIRGTFMVSKSLFSLWKSPLFWMVFLTRKFEGYDIDFTKLQSVKEIRDIAFIFINEENSISPYVAMKLCTAHKLASPFGWVMKKFKVLREFCWDETPKTTNIEEKGKIYSSPKFSFDLPYAWTIQQLWCDNCNLYHKRCLYSQEMDLAIKSGDSTDRVTIIEPVNVIIDDFLLSEVK